MDSLERSNWESSMNPSGSSSGYEEVYVPIYDGSLSMML